MNKNQKDNAKRTASRLSNAIEASSWIHPSRSNDGMPAASQGLGTLTDAATPIVAMAIRTFDLGNGVAAAHKQLANGSPLLVVLSTPMDNNELWLAVGLGLQRMLLVAAKEGYYTSYLNQPIEVPDLRVRLANELSIVGYPQLVLRVGRGFLFRILRDDQCRTC
jgi:hypothetical protein